MRCSDLDQVMAAASIATPASYASQRSAMNVTRRTSQTVTATSAGRRSSSTPSGPTTAFCRTLFFPTLAETAPQFPFCEAAYLAHAQIRWPPWPHRLDTGRRQQVYLGHRAVPHFQLHTRKRSWHIYKRSCIMREREDKKLAGPAILEAISFVIA